MKKHTWLTSPLYARYLIHIIENSLAFVKVMLAIALALMMTLILWNAASAAGPENQPPQDSDRRVGLLSTTVECLTVEAGASESASATVRLEWDGQVEQAYLLLAASGSEGAHSIYVNGQLVGSAPVQPGGQPCQANFPEEIPIPADLLVKGENVIVLTNDANINDGWTAADLHLEIHGVLSGPPVSVLKQMDASSSEIGATSIITGSVELDSTYDIGVKHVVWYQLLDSSCSGGGPWPLLVGPHGYSGDGEGVINGFRGDEARERCWYLVGPDMHGEYFTNTGKYALAWPGAQHDIIDAINYMIASYNIDTSRIYVAGGSMGGQMTVVMAAKYPDLFPAVSFYKPITDLADWYSIDLVGNYGIRGRIRSEADPSCGYPPDSDYATGCGTPFQVPFAYQRRSSMAMPQNISSFPLKYWHDEDDMLVGVYHSRDLKAEILSWNPSAPLTYIEVASADYSCPTDPDEHCFKPDQDEMFDFLQSYTRSTLAPLSLTIRTDESKPFFWLNVDKADEDHWTEVEASYNKTSKIVTAIISDTQSLALGFNLGSTSIPGTAGILQSGMGLPENTIYLVEEEGDNFYSYQQSYTSGYFTVTLNNTGQYTLTLSAIVDLQPQVYLPIVIKNN